MSWRMHATSPNVVTTDGSIVPAELQVVEHTVGYTEVVLANGDRLRLRLYVDKFTFDPRDNSYAPTYRVVSELQIREVRGNVEAVMEGCWHA